MGKKKRKIPSVSEEETGTLYNSYTLVVGMQNGAATLENGLAVLQMVKHQATI